MNTKTVLEIAWREDNYSIEIQRDRRVDARHPERRTITLPFSHQFLMNAETEAPSMPRMAFLD